MLIKTHKEIPTSEITAPEIFLARRRIIKSALATVALGSGITSSLGMHWLTQRH